MKTPYGLLIFLLLAVAGQLAVLAWLSPSGKAPIPSMGAKIPPETVPRDQKPELKAERFKPHPGIPRERIGTVYAAIIKLWSAEDPAVRLTSAQRERALKILRWTGEREHAWFAARAVIPLLFTAEQYRLLDERSGPIPPGERESLIEKAIALLEKKSGESRKEACRRTCPIVLKEGGAMHDLHRLAQVLVDCESGRGPSCTKEQAREILPLLAGAEEFELHRVLSAAKRRFYETLTPRQVAFVNENADSWDRDAGIPNYADIPRFRRMQEIVLSLVAGSASEEGFPETPGPRSKDSFSESTGPPSKDFFPETAGPAVRKGRSTHYRGNDLYKIIDGEADLFILYGYRVMHVVRYTGDSGEWEAQAAQLEDSLSAFGLFSRFTAESGAFLEIGDEGYRDSSMICFHKGRYFVRILALGRDDPAAAERIAKALSGSLPAKAPLPKEIAFFPPEGLVRSTVRYIPRNLLGRRFFPRGFEATYRRRGEESRAFLVLCADEGQAAAAAEAYTRAGAGPIVSVGRYCAGVAGVGGGAEDLCGEIAARIRTAGTP